MGKKPLKTKELAVAIEEATSAAVGDANESKQQSPAPRKRGRPRKTVVVESTGTGQREEAQKAPEVAEEDNITGPKRDKPASEGAVKTGDEKEDRVPGEKGPLVTRSRARRKSYKPRKSS
ncbi:hypothetical protein SAY87_031083 [Trapa incisa]|uniref:Uncharacterized protein n=1 Tax=Trapa incisa TaxID=236973 RepID=A0AAN7QL00_9MYRT|nr:hypothetical protein SAY87_031083 [Trapa incisa]